MNKSTKPFSIKERIKSFSYAINGLKILIQNEHNARIHLAASIVVILISYYLQISLVEWVLILFSIALVFIAELFNSSLEYLADAISMEKNNRIGTAKDMAAAAVLISAMFSVIVGLIVFIPKIMELV